MVLNYHHHTTFSKRDNKYYILSLHGVFIEELSKGFEKINLFLFENPNPNSLNEDYEIINNKINIVTLGLKQNLLARFLKANSYVSEIKKYDASIILVRSPTPLLNAIAKGYSYKIVPLIVGDYLENVSEIKANVLKKYLLFLYYNLYQREYLRTLARVKYCLMNNPYFIEKFKEVYQKVFLVSTSLVKTNFLTKALNHRNLKDKSLINILYVGRIDESKGLLNFVESIDLISKKVKKKIVFNIVGWEDGVNKPIESKMRDLAIKLKIQDSIIFYGKIKHGEDLYKQYNNADIFYIGSKATEGFPRVIWEAMATRIPVVCSKVGGIPFYLGNNHVYFLENLEPIEISCKIIECVENEIETKNKIDNAYELVKSYTLEASVEKIIKILHENC